MGKQEQSLETWEKRKARYARFLLGTGEFFCPYPWHKEERDEEERAARALFLQMKRGEPRAFLWEEASDFTCSQYRTQTVQNIRRMALLWAGDAHREEDGVCLSDILDAFDWMAQYGYAEGMEQTDNWWDWQIGVPLALLDCCFILRRELGEARIRQACRSVEYFSGRQTLTNPIFTGANLIWTAMISAMCGLLTEDGQEIGEAKRAALTQLHFVEEGDGFYRDGSFIQHEKLAYTGGYGISFLEQMSKMMVLLSDTPQAFSADEYGMLCYFLEHAFFPVTVDGQVMDMVCGREISRHFMRGNRAGKQLMDSMWRMSLCVDRPTADWLSGRVEAWQKGQERPCQFHYFDHMDRAVCRREAYSAGLALYSSRIQNYEAINQENKRGYHTGSGMLYLYPAGENAYEDCFWCTADMDHLPGTTVPKGSRPTHLHVQQSAFVGGVGLGPCGSAAMEVTEETYHVKKSWFFFADSIVCLGNDMSCLDGSLQTTVENQRISQKDEDGGEWHLEEKDGMAEWLYFGAAGKKTGRGVRFLQPARLHVKTERRSGTWTEINACSPLDTVYEASYRTAWMEHKGEPGEYPGYAYALYPVTRKEDMEGRGGQIECLAFDNRLHAVRHRKENRIAGVCWSMDGAALEFEGARGEKGVLRLLGPAVFMAEMRDTGMRIAAKNPLAPTEKVPIYVEGGGITYEIIPGSPWGDGVEPDGKAPGTDGYPAE